LNQLTPQATSRLQGSAVALGLWRDMMTPTSHVSLFMAARTRYMKNNLLDCHFFQVLPQFVFYRDAPDVTTSYPYSSEIV
jgi:hypothetical protein